MMVRCADGHDNLRFKSVHCHGCFSSLGFIPVVTAVHIICRLVTPKHASTQFHIVDRLWDDLERICPGDMRTRSMLAVILVTHIGL